MIRGRIAFDRYEYYFANTNLPGNPDLEGLETEPVSSSVRCTGRDIPDLFGTWVERDSSVALDASGNGKLDFGDIIVTEDSPVRNSDNPLQSGVVGTMCTVLDKTGDSLYCLSTFELPNGYVAYGGAPGGSMRVSGNSGCFKGMSATIEANLYDEMTSYAIAYSSPNPSTQNCLSLRDLRLYWTQKERFETVVYGSDSAPGDKLVVDSEITTYERVTGRVKGVCTVMPSLVGNTEFCTLTFDFPGGSIDVVGQMNRMIVTGTSGCFAGTTGYISGAQGRGSATYRLVVERNNNEYCTRDRFSNRLQETGPDSFFDIDGDGDLSVGDSFLFDFHLVNTIGGSLSNGYAAGICTLLGERYHAYCVTTFAFPEGRIVTAGYFEYQVVIGGTGCYSDFSGMFYGRDEGDGSFTYEVVEDV